MPVMTKESFLRYADSGIFNSATVSSTQGPTLVHFFIFTMDNTARTPHAGHYSGVLGESLMPPYIRKSVSVTLSSACRLDLCRFLYRNHSNVSHNKRVRCTEKWTSVRPRLHSRRNHNPHVVVNLQSVVINHVVPVVPGPRGDHRGLLFPRDDLRVQAACFGGVKEVFGGCLGGFKEDCVE